jgi:hypothetical protein
MTDASVIATPKRRWFQFTLRRLFAVAKVAGVLFAWIACQLNWIMQRHEYMEPFRSLEWAGPATLPWGDNDAPWSLRIFGERGVYTHWVAVADETSTDGQAEVERVRRLFPESRMCLVAHVDHPTAYHTKTPTTPRAP